MPVNYKEIRTKVSELLLNGNIFEPPVPVRDIALSLGARVLPYEFGDDVSGILVYEDNRGIIGYNSSNHRVRQRFTIAHELAHLLYHAKDNTKELFVDKDFIVKFRGDKEYTLRELNQERQANAFAAALLMPHDFILSEIKKPRYKGMSETKLIEEFAKLFDVSLAAMTYRFADLDINIY